MIYCYLSTLNPRNERNDMETIFTLFLPVAVIILCLLAGTGILIRGALGPKAASLYTGAITGTMTFLGRQFGHFCRHRVFPFMVWTLRTHWQFWLGVVVGILVTLVFTGHIS